MPTDAFARAMHRVTRVHIVGHLLPVEDGMAGIAALDGAVEIVPMVQDAQFEARRASDIEMSNRLARLDQPQKSEAAIKHANVAVGGDHCDGMTLERGAADQITFPAQRGRAANSGPRSAARKPASRLSLRHRPPCRYRSACPEARSSPWSVPPGQLRGWVKRLAIRPRLQADGIVTGRWPPSGDSAAKGHSHPRHAQAGPTATERRRQENAAWLSLHAPGRAAEACGASLPP